MTRPSGGKSAEHVDIADQVEGWSEIKRGAKVCAASHCRLGSLLQGC